MYGLSRGEPLPYAPRPVPYYSGPAPIRIPLVEQFHRDAVQGGILKDVIAVIYQLQ